MRLSNRSRREGELLDKQRRDKGTEELISLSLYLKVSYVIDTLWLSGLKIYVRKMEQGPEIDTGGYVM